MTPADLADLARFACANDLQHIYAMASHAAHGEGEWEIDSVSDDAVAIVIAIGRDACARACVRWLPLLRMWRAQEAADVIGVPV